MTHVSTFSSIISPIVASMACATVMLWLTNSAEDTRADGNHALRYSCRKGHLYVAQWLMDRFEPTIEDAHVEDNSVLYSRKNGHQAVTQWLTAEDAR